MKCTKCGYALHRETGVFSMNLDGRTITVTNAPVLHCRNCNCTVIDDEVKNHAEEFAKVYLSDDTVDYAQCEAAAILPAMNLLF